MNEMQKLRMLLLDKAEYNVGQAKECFDFVVGGSCDKETAQTEVGTKPVYSDGVYICYKDGRNVLFDETCDVGDVGDVRGVGLVVGSTSLCVSLRDIGPICLTNHDDDGECENYIQDWDLARIDTDGIGNTRHIKSVGTDITLGDWEYIPALGELYLIYLWKCKINKALACVGGENILDSWYWSSTEYSATNAWDLNFSYGYQSGNTKSLQYRMRAVAAFIPPSL